jgi:hypothetical protein
MWLLPRLQIDLGFLSPWGRFARVKRDLDSFLFTEFARRRAEGSAGRDDILSLLLAARYEDGEPMRDEELRDQMVTLLFAGHETTATSLAFAFHNILGHPEVLGRLHQERAQVIGAEPVAPAQFGKLEYLDATIKDTARKGYLDIHMRAERHNAVKVLIFFDVGGSMDWHIKATEELFSAARTEFKHMEHMYFHNCLYEKVWKENRRRFDHTTPTWDVLHTYPHDYKVIFVGDAAMSPYEIMAPGGSVEHYNEETGAVWTERVVRTYPACVWLNPVPEKEWDFTQSIRMMRQLMGGRMYPLTLEGLDRAMRELVR